MATLPTFDELQTAARNEIQSRRPDLTDFNEGSALDAITGAAAVLADEAILVAVQLFKALFFDTAEGEDLDALAQDRFGISRKPATASIGELTWTRNDPGAYTIPAATRFRASVAGQTIEVQSTAAVDLAAADSSVLIPVQALVLGRATNAAAGTVTEILDTVAEDPNASVTNAQPLAGGSDAETDPQLRDRIRRIYSTLRRGTVAALETGSLSVPGVSIVTIDESEVEASGWVYVYIGDPDARSNSTLAALVAAELESWRAAGVLVSVLGASREEKALSITVFVEPGSDQAAVGEAIRLAIIAYGDTLDPDEAVQLSRIQKACHDASDLVVGTTISTSAAALVPSASQNAVRFVATAIALSFVEVS